AMKATKAGQIVGKALADFAGPGQGTIMTFISTTYIDPTDMLQNLALNQDGKLTVNNQVVSLSSETETVNNRVTDLTSTTTTTFNTVGQRLDILEQEYASLSAQLQHGPTGPNVTESGDLSDVLNRISTNEAQLTDHSNRITNLESAIHELQANASISALL